MRKESFMILFETKAGMTELVTKPCMWRSALYFVASMGLYSGVVTNTWLLNQPLEVRGAMVLSVVMFFVLLLVLYSMLLHGILETFGALAGDAKALICVAGYTAMPFLVFTPVALLAGKLGLGGLPLLAFISLVALVWMHYLLIRALEVVYIISFWQSLGVIVFSLVLLYVFFTWPVRVGFHLIKALVA